SSGLGGLVGGLGDTVASVGGLVNADPANPNALVTVLDNATGALAALTGPLGDEGGLLSPVGQLVGKLVAVGGEQPVLEPALGNVGQTVDNLAPLGLSPTLAGVGASLDTIVSPVVGSSTKLTQRVGDGVGLGQPVDQLLTSIGGSLEGAGAGLPFG